MCCFFVENPTSYKQNSPSPSPPSFILYSLFFILYSLSSPTTRQQCLTQKAENAKRFQQQFIIYHPSFIIFKKQKTRSVFHHTCPLSLVNYPHCPSRKKSKIADKKHLQFPRKYARLKKVPPRKRRTPLPTNAKTPQLPRFCLLYILKAIPLSTKKENAQHFPPQLQTNI